MQVLELEHRVDEIGAVAVFVTFDEPGRLREGLLAGLQVPFPVLIDHDRTAYDAWGLARSSVRGVWLDPRVWRQYAMLLDRGERLRRPGSDTLQLGGDFVIDPRGTVVYARPQARDDRPPVGELLAALQSTVV